MELNRNMGVFLHNLYQPVVKVVAQYNSPKWEALKSVLRVGIMIAVSWVITTILSQLNLVPEFTSLNVWVFSFTIPVRAAIFWTLTALQKWLDKWLWEKDKERGRQTGEHSVGLYPV